MHLLDLKLEHDRLRDTQVDVRVPIQLRPVRSTAPRSPEPEVEEPIADEDTGPAAPVLPLSKKSSPGWRLRIRESAQRRGHRARTMFERPVQDAIPGPCLVRLDWIRSLDSVLKVTCVGRDTIRIEGRAAGTARGPRQKPSVSVGVDGRMYTVGVTAGQRAGEAAEVLAQRLRRAFEVQVQKADGEVATVRLVRER